MTYQLIRARLSYEKLRGQVQPLISSGVLLSRYETHIN